MSNTPTSASPEAKNIMVRAKKQWKIPQENVEKYREYRSRPVGVTEFERLPDGSYNVHVKECFCRVATRDADGNVIFCPEKKRFERKDNLIAHIKQAHRAEWDAMDASGKMNKAGNVSKERKEAAEAHFTGQVNLIKEATETENRDDLSGSTDNLDQPMQNDAILESGIKKRQRHVIKKDSRSASVVTNEDDSESDGESLFVKRTKTKSEEATILKEETPKGAGPSSGKELNNSPARPISETFPRVQGTSHAHPTPPQSTAPSPMASTRLNPSQRLDHVATGIQNIEWEALKAREVGLFTPQQLGQFQININQAELHVEELRKVLAKNTQYERLRPIFDSIQELEKLILKDIGGNRFEPRKMSLLQDSLKDTLSNLASISSLFSTA